MKKWTVLIRGIGSRDVEAKDIDGAYAAAMDIFSCKLDLTDPLDDVFCALWNTPGSRGKCRAVLEAVFERMFGTKLSEAEAAELKELRNLAPGDFRTVRQELFYLGEEATNEDRIAALKEECAVKKDGEHSHPIGFAA